MLTFDQIKELVELVSQRGLSGLEIERSGFRLKIDGQAAPNAAHPAAGAGATAQAAQPAPVPAPGAPPALPAAPGAALAAGPAPGDHILNSPIVGTFYRAPAPGADSFVQVGSRVERGQVLCIIEAMKLMNEIESDADGVIEQIFPQNAQAVEFGEPLFAIRTS